MTTELSREMVRTAPQITNAIQQRELSLRGLHIAMLPVTDGQLWLDVISNFDCLDLSDNVLQWLDAPSLPVRGAKDVAPDSAAASAANSKAAAINKRQQQQQHAVRVTSLILHKNRIRGISRTFASQLSSTITSIVLHDNAISNLSDCDIFGRFEKLERLSLCGNPVRDRAGYRRHVISVCVPSLKLLDFAKIKDVERADAAVYKEKRAEEEEQQQQQETARQQRLRDEAGGGSNNNGGGGGGSSAVALGAGKRAARKAAALAATSVGEDGGDGASGIAEGKRDRGAASAAAGVSGKDEKLGAALRSRPQQMDESSSSFSSSAAAAAAASLVDKEARKKELQAALEAADSVEEMDRIEEELRALGF